MVMVAVHISQIQWIGQLDQNMNASIASFTFDDGGVPVLSNDRTKLTFIACDNSQVTGHCLKEIWTQPEGNHYDWTRAEDHLAQDSSCSPAPFRENGCRDIGPLDIP